MRCPLLMLVLLGMIDFGIAFNYNNDETSLANQAIRFAVVNSCAPCGTRASRNGVSRTYVKNNADSGNLMHGGGGVGIQSPGVTITFCTTKAGYAAGQALAVGDPLTAKVTARYMFVPYLIAKVGIPSTVTISASVTQRVESPYFATGGGTNAFTVLGAS